MRRILGAMVGLAAGDALGVPVQFEPRAAREADPVIGMRGGGTWRLEPGTWSDDTSLALCLAQSIVEKGFDPEDSGRRALAWLDEGLWAAKGESFDVGGATRRALDRIRSGLPATLAGGRGENDNGNGSLMRILPASAWLAPMPEPARFRAIASYSSVTHGHPRSLLACWLHCLVTARLLRGEEPKSAYADAMADARTLLGTLPAPVRAETGAFARVLDGALPSLGASSIRGSGYVVHCLEAALWCLTTTRDLRSCVLEAVNLGEDADTTAAVAGGFAGLAYGREAVPADWAAAIVRLFEIEALALRLETLVDAKAPLPRSYWVLPGKLLAGGYPGRGRADGDADGAIERILGAGIDVFLDLTDEGEDIGAEAYGPRLDGRIARGGLPASRLSAAMRDMSAAPEKVQAALDKLDSLLSAGNSVYLHCLGGLGRTGMVVGSYLAEKGLARSSELVPLLRRCAPRRIRQAWNRLRRRSRGGSSRRACRARARCPFDGRPVKLALVSMAAGDSEALPLGAACVAAAIKAAAGGDAASRSLASIETVLLEAAPGESPDALASRIAASGAGIVGFSVYSWNRTALAATSTRLRGAAYGMLLFAGGPEATADPDGLVAEAALDFAVAGEGESAVVAALRAILGGGKADALSDIPGIVLPRALGDTDPSLGLGASAACAPLEDPAALASPWLLGVLDPSAAGGDIVWELSRGCPFRCAYCYESKGRSGTRPFPIERAAAELELFARAGVRYAFVLDPTFDADLERAAALLDLMRSKGKDIRWKFEVRAELLDRSLVKRFADLDCSLQVGLQSSRRETLEAVGRPGFDRREFSRKVAMLSQAGVTFGLDLIYGLPGDGLRDFEESLDFALGLEPNHLDVFPLALLPGTELMEKADEMGIVADARPPYLVRSTRELSTEGMRSATALAAACDRFYSAGRAVGWFKAAIAPLRTRPSEFLRSYWAALERRAPKSDAGSISDSRAIEREQLEFLQEAYAAAGASALLPALQDLVRLHGAWGRALAEGATSLLSLAYDPDEVLGAAAGGLRAFVRTAEPRRASWRVIPDEGEGARFEEA